ncbi:hypothetical protein B0H13DRAFT_1886530 [Mycena leptocephala]|nr:hypothetical protein B0H13DRAFT_1886530 [Mycena leptocephala]
MNVRWLNRHGGKENVPAIRSWAAHSGNVSAAAPNVLPRRPRARRRLSWWAGDYRGGGGGRDYDDRDKEAGVAGMMIGGIRCRVMCAQNDGPLDNTPACYRGLGSREFYFCVYPTEWDPKLQTFVAAGDRYLLAVNWTAKFATTGAPFSLRISESSSAKPGNFHTMEDAGVRVADQRDAQALHKRTTGRLCVPFSGSVPSSK